MKLEYSKDIKTKLDELCELKATTIVAERSFSIAGIFFSVRRKRMSKEVLSSLVFLNYFYRNNNG